MLAALAAAAVVAVSPCQIGEVVSERVVLRPRSGTFYSIDVLNPDVIRWRDGYLMFFSGNRAATDAGVWATGVAVAERPEGPYRVLQRVGDFYNGGTARWRRQLWHGASDRDGAPILLRSSDGLAWRKVAGLPENQAWRAITSDLYARSVGERLRVYFAGRSGATGADLGSVTYLGRRRWHGFRKVMRRENGWDRLDLGEPAVFSLQGRQLMLYGGLGENGEPRHVGLAYKDGSAWRRCPGPLTARASRFTRRTRSIPSRRRRRPLDLLRWRRPTQPRWTHARRILVRVYDASSSRRIKRDIGA